MGPCLRSVPPAADAIADFPGVGAALAPKKMDDMQADKKTPWWLFAVYGLLVCGQFLIIGTGRGPDIETPQPVSGQTGS